MMVTSAQRVTFLWAALASYGFLDVGLTLVAAAEFAHFRELNPVARWSLEGGLALPFMLKAVALLLVLGVARVLAESPHARLVERTLLAWCLIYALIAAYSLTRILGGF